MTRKLGLSKDGSERIFIDFSLQCELRLEDWCMAKRKMYWDRCKSFSASVSLLWVLIRDLHHKKAKNPFFLKSHLSRWPFVTWIRWKRQPTWYRDWVDTSWFKSTMSWLGLGHWTASRRRPAGGGIGTDTQCILVIIVRVNLILYLQKTQLPAPSGPSTGL